MASQKAWYWLAAGVLALGINSEYQSGRLTCVHSYVDHSLAVAQSYSRCARTYLTHAETLFALTRPAPAQEDGESLTDAESVLAREQVQYALAQTAQQQLERHRSELDRALRQLDSHREQIEMAQRIAMDTAGHAVVVCPHTPSIRVSVPHVRIPQVRVNVPEINIPEVSVEVPEVDVDSVVAGDDNL